MEETGISMQQSSVGAEGSGGYTAPPASDVTASASSADTYTNTGTASDSGGGSQPPAAATSEAGSNDNVIASSDGGSVQLVYNERTGRNEVKVVTKQTQQPEQQEKAQPAGEYSGNELMQAAQQAVNMPVPPPQNAEYSLPELQEAMRSGQVDESRIPVNMRQSYYLATAPQQQPQPQPAQPEAQTQQATEDNTAKAREFYSKVQQMAVDRAMKETGITQDEIDVAEYTDDPELIQKANAYKVAVENNRAQILKDVDDIQRQQRAVENDRAVAYQSIVSFVNEMRKKEPNFDAIDRLMTTRVDKMPHEKAKKIEPLLNKVRNNTLSTADLPALQEMYNETRLEFYSQREGVGIAPQFQRPAYVETPGAGKEPPRQTTPLSELGKMSKKDKINAIGQMFSNFLDEE